MMRDRPARAFFGLPLSMPRDEAERLLATLAESWEAQYGPLREVDRDLKQMYRSLFKPIARENTLRETLDRVAQQTMDAELPEGVRLDVGGAQLVTPEARVTIEVLERVLEEQPEEILDFSEAAVTAERFI